jgi:hypothetical protein
VTRPTVRGYERERHQTLWRAQVNIVAPALDVIAIVIDAIVTQWPRLPPLA